LKLSATQKQFQQWVVIETLVKKLKINTSSLLLTLALFPEHNTLKIMQAHHNFLECKWPTKLLSASCVNQQPNSIVHVENLDNTSF
jgi:hypothetical protein